MVRNILLITSVSITLILFSATFFWVNFIPSDSMQLYSPFFALFCFVLSCYLFRKYYSFWEKAAHRTIGINGGVKTEIGATISCFLFGISIPAVFFYLLAMNTIPLVLTFVIGEERTQEYIFEALSFSSKRCSPQLTFKNVDEFSSHVCRLKTDSKSKLKKGDHILISGLKSDFGMIPKSYVLLGTVK